MKQYANEFIRDEIIKNIKKMPVERPEEVFGNMDEFTTRFTWESGKSVLNNLPQENHFEFISSLFAMTVFHQAVFTYFRKEYTKYRSCYQFPEFGGGGMAGTHHVAPWDLFTFALQNEVISVDEMNSRDTGMENLFKAWAEFMIDDCKLDFSYENLLEKLRTDYTLAVRQKVRNQHREGFPEEYVSAIEEVIRQMLGCSKEERQEDLKTIERNRQIKRLREKHHVGMKYLEDK